MEFLAPQLTLPLLLLFIKFYLYPTQVPVVICDFSSSVILYFQFASKSCPFFLPKHFTSPVSTATTLVYTTIISKL